MEENRKQKRTNVSLTLEVSSLFKQDNVRVNHINAPIEVKNVSKSGIGFESKSILPIGYYFNARLEFAKAEEALNCVVRIVRQSDIADGKKFYGCEFVGLSSVFDYIFDGIEDVQE